METGRTSHSPTPGATSRACVTCARAKAKCVPGPDASSKCSRCNRLSKVCEPAVRRPRVRSENRRRPNRVSNSHVKQLEEKLDGLVSLLKSARDIAPTDRGSSTSSMPSVSIPDPDIRVSSVPPDEVAPNYVQSLPHPEGNRTYAARFTPKVTDPYLRTFDGPEWANVSTPLPTKEEAEDLLKAFRNEVNPFFPFISIRESSSASELRIERPFTYLAIMAITSPRLSKRLEISQVIIKQVGQRVFVDSERSIDLLFGVLTFASWFYSQLHTIQHLTALTGAAKILVFDLGLHRLPQKESPSLLEEALYKTLKVPIINPMKTLDEKRALLGYFILSANVAMCFRRTESLRYSSYFEECRQSLAESDDHPNDVISAGMVKLQAILERIYHSPWTVRDNPSGSLPVVFFVSSIEEQLKRFREEFSAQMADNKPLLVYYYITQIAAYQTAISRPVGDNTTCERNDFKQVELLYACLRATKGAFDLFFSIDRKKYFHFSLLTWTQARLALIALQRLSIYDDPDWDLGYVRGTLDFLWVMEELYGRIEKAAVELGFDDEHVFPRTAVKMKIARAYCQERMVAPQQGISDYIDLSLLDDMWFQNAYGMVDYPPNAPGTTSI